MSTYTHTGYRPSTGYRYCSSRLYGHDAPKPGKTHALVQEDHPQLGSRWRGLCGEVVHDNSGKDDYGDEINPNVRAIDDPKTLRVTCKRCLCLAAKKESVT